MSTVSNMKMSKGKVQKQFCTKRDDFEASSHFSANLSRATVSLLSCRRRRMNGECHFRTLLWASDDRWVEQWSGSWEDKRNQAKDKPQAKQTQSFNKSPSLKRRRQQEIVQRVLKHFFRLTKRDHTCAPSLERYLLRKAKADIDASLALPPCITILGCLLLL